MRLDFLGSALRQRSPQPGCLKQSAAPYRRSVYAYVMQIPEHANSKDVLACSMHVDDLDVRVACTLHADNLRFFLKAQHIVLN